MEFDIETYKALDFKTDIQWGIAWNFLSSEIMVWGIYPFFILIMLCFLWIFICENFKWKTSLPNPYLIKVTKNIIPAIGIFGVLITAFSIWGFK